MRIGYLLTCMPLLLLSMNALAQQTSVAITHVSVIDPNKDEPARDQTVLVAGDRIASVGPTSQITIPETAVRVDASGKYVIPGLWDMHVHLTGNSGFTALYIANGVTGVRDMGTPIEQIVATRMRVESGHEQGPRIMAAGQILEATSAGPLTVAVPDVETAQREVAARKRSGADFIKVGSLLSREVYFAILDEAKKAGLTVAGHLPRSVGAAEASAAGQASIEHLDGYFVASSSREKDFTAEILATQPKVEEARKKLESSYTQENGIAYGKLLMRILGEIPVEAMQTLDETKAQELAATFAKNKTWQCPTLTALRAMQNLGDPGVKTDTRNKYVEERLRVYWEVDPRFQDRRQKSAEELAGGMKPILDAVRRLHSAKVPILAGTDCTNPYVFPGFSLHEELILLVEAGMTPREALYAATLAPAIYLGREQDLGTIAPGKLADLVVLDANPFDSIQNTSKIHAVILDGKLIDRSSLNKLLEEVIDSVASED